jgi:hypothetical protein
VHSPTSSAKKAKDVMRDGRIIGEGRREGMNPGKVRDSVFAAARVGCGPEGARARGRGLPERRGARTLEAPSSPRAVDSGGGPAAAWGAAAWSAEDAAAAEGDEVRRGARAGARARSRSRGSRAAVAAAAGDVALAAALDEAI